MATRLPGPRPLSGGILWLAAALAFNSASNGTMGLRLAPWLVAAVERHSADDLAIRMGLLADQLDLVFLQFVFHGGSDDGSRWYKQATHAGESIFDGSGRYQFFR
jgi:hypothetical protein